MRDIEFKLSTAWVDDTTQFLVIRALLDIKKRTDKALEKIDAML